MAAPEERHSLTCESCNRALSLTKAQLQKRRNCGYCGQPLKLSAELEASLAAQSAQSAKPDVAAQAVSIECPICSRAARVKVNPAANKGKCMFCGCPMIMPPQGGLGVASPSVEMVPPLVLSENLATPCPLCKAAKSLTPTDVLGHQALCSACKLPVDCALLPLENFVDLAPGKERTPTVQFARHVLRARWKQKELGLREAAKLFEAMEKIDQAASITGGPPQSVRSSLHG